MALVRYNSVFPGLANNLFADLLADYPTQYQFNPKVDVAETEKTFEVHVSLPGFKKEDIIVELDENRLTMSGQRKWEERALAISFDPPMGTGQPFRCPAVNNTMPIAEVARLDKG